MIGGGDETVPFAAVTITVLVTLSWFTLETLSLLGDMTTFSEAASAMTNAAAQSWPA